jgi:hypothetical protein
MKKPKPTILCNNCRNAWHGQSACPPRKLSDTEVLNVIGDARQKLYSARHGLQAAFAALVEANDLLPAYSNRITEIDNLVQSLWQDLGLVRNEVESTKPDGGATASEKLFGPAPLRRGR